MIRRWASILLVSLGLGWAARWIGRKILGVEVTLIPTSETTPPLTPTDIRKGMRRIVVSDLHLGAGDRLDDFRDDVLFVDFVRTYVNNGTPTELILAGDTFEFLQVRLPGINDYTWSAEVAAQRLHVILRAHPEVVSVLRSFVAFPGNQLTILIGNHDFELHYRSAKALLRKALALSEGDASLRFGLDYQGDGIYIVHGNQFDRWNHFSYMEGISEPFEIVRGTRIVKDVINRLEDDPLPIAPQIDNIKPVSAFFWYLLSLQRLRSAEVRRFVVRGLLMFFRVNIGGTRYQEPVIDVKRELLGTPEQCEQREAMLGAVYANEEALRQAAAVVSGGVEPQLNLGPLAQEVGQRMLQGTTDEVVREQLTAEAEQQLTAEVQAFADATAQAMAQVALQPTHRDEEVFVCGHTHIAGITNLNSRQTYYNTGTWTAVLRHVAVDGLLEYARPFLEIQPGPVRAQAELFVWKGLSEPPVSWDASVADTNQEGEQ